MAALAMEGRNVPMPSEEQVNVPEEMVKTNGQKRARVVMGPPITDGANTDEDEVAEEEDDGDAEEEDVLAELPDDTEVSS